jgi:hypothetical protein
MPLNLINLCRFFIDAMELSGATATASTSLAGLCYESNRFAITQSHVFFPCLPSCKTVVIVSPNRMQVLPALSGCTGMPVPEHIQ